MILAAGLGTRLRPWTLTHPKALVPVGDRPMLERIIERLRTEGFDDIVVNVHHFGQQIIDFLSAPEYASIRISDERPALLNTGGGVLKAVGDSAEPVLIHNVDILSTASLTGLWEANIRCDDVAATLLVSYRRSSRKLAFDSSGRLTGWVNLSTGQTRGQVETSSKLLAFSGIYVTNPIMLRAMATYAGTDVSCRDFALMDFILSHAENLRFQAHEEPNLRMLDIGKPEALAGANDWLLANGL